MQDNMQVEFPNYFLKNLSTKATTEKIATMIIYSEIKNRLCMKKIFHGVTELSITSASFILVSLLMFVTACQKQPVQEVQGVSSEQSSKHSKSLKEFEQFNLVADVTGYNAARID